jgi:acyl carrier protein
MTLPAALLAVVTAIHPADPDELSAATRLDELGFDSLDRIRLATQVEAAFDIQIADEDLADVDRIGDLAALLGRGHRQSAGQLVPTFPIPVQTNRSTVDAAMFVHPTATVGEGVAIGQGSRVWHQAQLADGVVIGTEVTLGKGVYLGAGTRVGNRVKIQNGCGVFGATIDDEVMLCPGVFLIEDSTPRAVSATGTRKSPDDWTARPVTIKRGATVGTAAVVLPGVTIGQYAMVTAAALVTRDVPPHAMVAGNPARQVGWVCYCGTRLVGRTCGACGIQFQQVNASEMAPAE